MRCTASVPSLAAALLLLAVPGAHANDRTLVGMTAQASVEAVTASDGGVYAVVTLESRLHLWLTGQLDLYVNGNQLPLGDVATRDQLILTERVGDASDPPEVCVVFRGWLEMDDDLYRRVEQHRCAGEPLRVLPAPGDQPFVSLQPRLRPQAGN